MQKINKKWSILLWAVMLSLIISILFISISSKINKNIKNSWDTSNYISEKNKINKSIYNILDSEISSNNILIFEKNKKNTFSLKKNETLELSFSWTSDFNIDLWIIKWWTILYSYKKINSSNNKIETFSWVLNYSKSFSWNLDSIYNKSKLKLKNLWWYSNFLINSEINFETSKKTYKIIKIIWNNNLIQTKWTK